MKEDPPEIVKWEKKRSVRKKQAAPFGFSQTSLRPAGIRHPFFSHLHLFFHLPDQRFPAVSFCSFLQVLSLLRPCAGGSLFFSRGWWWWPTVWRLWRCRRRTGWPAGWGAGSPPYWPTSRRAPLYDTPPAGGTHWPPGASRKNVLHLALVSERSRQSREI